jgi:4-hydroxy-2-oxoheptanedioate aldolase
MILRGIVSAGSFLKTGADMNEAVVGKLSEGLATGAPVLSAWVGVNEAAVAEALAREAFDAVILDMQHGAFDFAGVSRAILAVALAGRPSIVRIPVGDFPLASRLIDAGAAGVIAPMINSRADAELFASFTKFPPLGDRSWGPRAALPLSGLEPPEYFRSANAIVTTVAMIETRSALEALDDILAVDGVDGVFIGPSDLSIALSDGRKLEPRGPALLAAAGQVVARARAHGKFAGMFCFDGADARAMAALDFKLCSVSSDLAMLRAAARAELAAARGQTAATSGNGAKSY